MGLGVGVGGPQQVAFLVEYYDTQDAKLAAFELGSGTTPWGRGRVVVEEAERADRERQLGQQLLLTLHRWREEHRASQQLLGVGGLGGEEVAAALAHAAAAQQQQAQQQQSAAAQAQAQAQAQASAAALHHFQQQLAAQQQQQQQQAQAHARYAGSPPAIMGGLGGGGLSPSSCCF